MTGSDYFGRGVDEDGRERDRQGRIVPHRLGLLGFAKAIPGLMDQFRAIPAEFWTEDVTDDSEPMAVVACPCGETPQAVLNELAGCECERYFAFTGREVRVANSPK